MSSVSTDRLQGVNVGAAVKVPCRVATTVNITLSGLQTIDGVAAVQDDRILVKNQTTSSENGIYLADSGAWQRDKDWDGSYDVKKGTVVHVTEGATYTRTWWEVTTSDPITVGTTGVTIIQGITDSAIITFLPSGIGTGTPLSQTVQTALRRGFVSADYTGAAIGLTAWGTSALRLNTSGAVNTAFGESALAANLSGYGNTAIGYQALKANTIGGSNTFGGNTAVGAAALTSNISGDNNTAVGLDALFTNTDGYSSVAVGSNAIGFGDHGYYNVAVGYRALFNGGAGNTNTCIGYSSLLSNLTGTNNVAIGAFAGAYELGSNAFYVDNQDRTNTAGDKAKALLYGTFNATAANQTLTVNAKLIANHADAALNQLFAGTTKAIRIGHTASESVLEGVDVTGVTSYQPLVIGGSSLVFQLSGVTVATIAGGLQVGAPTGGDKGAGTINAAAAYYANGTAGVVTFGPAAVASITVKNGIITAIS